MKEEDLIDQVVGVLVYLREQLNVSLEGTMGYDQSNTRARAVRKAIKLVNQQNGVEGE